MRVFTTRATGIATATQLRNSLDASQLQHIGFKQQFTQLLDVGVCCYGVQLVTVSCDYN